MEKKDNLLSPVDKYEKGVKQGDALSTLPFNVYISDINKIFDASTSDPVDLNFAKLNCLVYADDLLLLSEGKEGLQSCLDSLQMYCDSWKLKINVDKTKVIIFNNGKTDTKSLKFMIHNSEIEIIEKYKYLSVALFYNGNIKHAANHLC